MHVFFAPDIVNGNLQLDQQEATHAVRVLRLSPGDEIRILDGAGNVYQAVLENTAPSHCTFSIINKKEIPPRELALHIAIAPTKMNDRTEWFLEKAVELGIERVTPVICDRSERRHVNEDRYKKIVLAAVKQSQQPWMPVLDAPLPFNKFIESNQNGFIAHCADEVRNPIQQLIPSHGAVTVLIGPEGDFTPNEVELAVKKGWKPVSLGDSRLRTETAALYVAGLIRNANEKMVNQ